jgi:excisionase family DNA binding protein
MARTRLASTPLFVLFVWCYGLTMATPLVERTVLPPERPERLGGVLAALASRPSGRPALVSADGERLELPPEVFQILRDVVEALAQGLAITIAPHQTVLSTSEAAEILGVSRPTLVRLLESGEIPFEQPGRHRRVRLADVLAYSERARRQRAAVLDQMVADAEDAGLYDLPNDVPFERLPIEGDGH